MAGLPVLTWLTVAAACLWTGLLLTPWQPWRNRETLDPDGPATAAADEDLSDITVLIPARNEAGHIAGSTNGRMMYIRRHRHVVYASDFWNADRASAAVDVVPSGSRSSRRMKRSAAESDGGAAAGGAPAGRVPEPVVAPASSLIEGVLIAALHRRRWLAPRQLGYGAPAGSVSVSPRFDTCEVHVLPFQ